VKRRRSRVLLPNPFPLNKVPRLNSMLMKRLIAAAALFSSFSAAWGTNIPDPPAMEVKAYALLDYQSGDLIAAYNADERVEPASITKVLTTYIAFDEIKKGRVKPDDTALISEKAWHEGIDSSESRMFLQVGSQVKISDLLRGIIVVSGNDASIALSEHLAGSEEAFADLMNQYAKNLGMKNSHFVDASGMPNADHYTTAHDLTILGRALIHNFPDDYKIYSEREFKYGIEHPQQNRNGLLWKDATVDGIKTGHTNAAGYCLLSSATRDGRRLVAAVMGDKSWAGREQDSLALLNWGFRFYETDSYFGPSAPAAQVRVWKGDGDHVDIGTLEPITLALPRESGARVQVTQTIKQPVIAPLEVGTPVGEAVISLDGKVLRTEPLVALQALPRGGLWRRMIDQIRLWFHMT